MSNFAIYMMGTALIAAGLAYAAYVLGADSTWIIIIVLIVIGFGITGGIRKTRRGQSSDK